MPPSQLDADVKVMHWGLCYLTVCAPVGTPWSVLEGQANRQHPTGLDHGWRISENPTFSGGQPNPCPCEQVEGRQHTLLSC